MAATFVECRDKEEALLACNAGILRMRGFDGSWDTLVPELDLWYVEAWYGKQGWTGQKFAVLVDDEE